MPDIFGQRSPDKKPLKQSDLWRIFSRGIATRSATFNTSEIFDQDYVTGRTLAALSTDLEIAIDQLFRIIKGSSVLNLGSGRGTLDAELRNLASSYVHLDLPYSLQELRKKDTAIYGNWSAPIVGGSGFELPFADQVFDVVIATFVHPLYCETAQEAKLALDEQLRVLGPGGTLILGPLDAWSTETTKGFVPILTELRDSSEFSIGLHGSSRAESAIVTRR